MTNELKLLRTELKALLEKIEKHTGDMAGDTMGDLTSTGSAIAHIP